MPGLSTTGVSPPCAADLGCTSPSLSLQSPVLPALSSSLSENDLSSPVEPPAPQTRGQLPVLPGSPAGITSVHLSIRPSVHPGR